MCALPDRNAAAEVSQYQDPIVIRQILLTARTIAIVGLSSNALRPSNFVGFYLQRHGYRIVPVNPREKEALGQPAFASLSDVPFPVDVVDVFRAPQFVPEVAKEAVKIGAKALWLQFGVISPEGARIARDGGLQVVVDRCMKVEHARNLGRMHWLGFNTGVVGAQRASTL
ncbi:MAG: CoA-binding protein [Chloroflexi bacterium]|nr:CoA-binding protein [Chloroflexota bacterium]MBV9133465.1 CoA-binding protein [Chloroflexota bacterium]MBV9894993.1 CoA-binding protein [Chloroflexota bacterium]